MPTPPSILFIGGHDPVGGAGLQADIETACSLQCRAYSLVTCLTTQDSRNVQALHPQPPQQLLRQLRLLLDDVRPDLVKVGLLGDARLASLLAPAIAELDRPVVFDPVLAAGGGTDLASAELIDALRELWLPMITLLTPNRAEARRLAGDNDPISAVGALLATGCDYVLLTGADEAEGVQVRNSLFDGKQRLDYDWPRLPHTYHGSGCTLASACACELARGQPMVEAVQAAQSFAWQTLQRAQQPGHGQHLPTRWSGS